MRIREKLVAILKRAYSRLAPVRADKIVFDNFGGKGFGENLKYIAEEIARRGLKVRMYWLVSDMDTDLPPWLNKIQIGTLRADYELQTAGFVISNYRRKWSHPKKRGQIFLQTWHGGIGMKRIEKDAEEKLSEVYVSIAKEDGRLTDGILADGAYIEKIYRRAFWLNDRCEILRYGSPRADVLLDAENAVSIRRKVRENLGISDDAYVALYAPTFRNSGTTEGYIADLEAVRMAFAVRHENVVILVRLHPNVARTASGLKYIFSNKLINVTAYSDPQELIIAADCGITDYSSIVYDFAMMRKPGFLCMKDLENFLSERGVYDAFYNQPFTMNYGESELKREIASFDEVEYQSRLNVFFEKYPTYNKGDASKRAVDWLIGKGLGS